MKTIKLNKHHMTISKDIKLRIKLSYAFIVAIVSIIALSVLISTIQEPQEALNQAQVSFRVSELVAEQTTPKEALTAYFTEKAPHLLPCVDSTIQHKRWVEAVAITRIETNFGTTGHGLTPKNNLGNISSSLAGRPNGRFKTYTNQCESIEDIAILLEKPRYKTLTIESMNGTYCVDETTSKGGECPNWTEVTMEEIDYLNEILKT